MAPSSGERDQKAFHNSIYSGSSWKGAPALLARLEAFRRRQTKQLERCERKLRNKARKVNKPCRLRKKQIVTNINLSPTQQLIRQDYGKENSLQMLCDAVASVYAEVRAQNSEENNNEINVATLCPTCGQRLSS
eukprot:CAMPEP_0198710368 /NCGR_PEP_ID=MMETSP1471-20131121/2687_1 /TAXON_ID=41880 /ORGANISM="Pycnococcus provasolii, Strain RCC733" /LENGTH=133 /DNA_ID=CAMNT_0044469997 /DNA_START=158 /DNA_END=559 /DNA_ORIENTATION=-